jgi:hypothetical protein
MAKPKVEKVTAVFIKGNIPSLKNSKIKTSRGIFPSKTVMNFLRELGIQKYSASRQEVVGFKTKPNLFDGYAADIKKMLKNKKPPYIIYFHFVRKTKTKFDFNNANQIILDLLTAHKVIPDDNMDYVIPAALMIYDKWYSVNKDNPGVWITID